MNHFLIACAIIAAVSALEWKPHTLEELNGIRDSCIEKNKVSAEDVENIKNFTYTESMKPYVGCFARESGIWDDATGFNVERAVQQYKFNLPEDKVRDILTKCISDNKTEGAETPYDHIIPVQRCLQSSEIGTALKASLTKTN